MLYSRILRVLLRILTNILGRLIRLNSSLALLIRINVLLTTYANVRLITYVRRLVTYTRRFLPRLITLLPERMTSIFPFSLRLGRLIANLLPLDTVYRLLDLLRRLLFLLRVLYVLTLSVLRRFDLLTRRFIINSTRTLRSLRIRLLEDGTCLLPFALGLSSDLNDVLPVKDLLLLLRVSDLGLFTRNDLINGVLLLLNARVLRILLILLISCNAYVLRTNPSFLTRLFYCEASFTMFLIRILRLIRN